MQHLKWIVHVPFCEMKYMDVWRGLPGGEAQETERARKAQKDGAEFSQTETLANEFGLNCCKILVVKTLQTFKRAEEIFVQYVSGYQFL